MKGQRTNLLFLAAALSLIASVNSPNAWAKKAATVTTLVVSSGGAQVNTIGAGSVITLTASVRSGGNAVIQGQVKFCDASAGYCTDIKLLGISQITASGTATLKLTPGIGAHLYRAIFLSTRAIASSRSDASSLTITHSGISPTTTALRVSGNAGNYSLIATVAGKVNQSSIASPAGTVSFLDTSSGDTSIATASLVKAPANLAWPTSHVIPGQNLAPAPMVIADVNGDGILDVVSGNGLLLLGNGDGTFRTTTFDGGGYGNVVPADFNNDGNVDFATCGYVGVDLGHGDGTSGSKVYLPADGDSLAVADFNGDGNADIIAAESIAGTVTLLLGNGDGSFMPGPAFPHTSNPLSIQTGDFNGDGVPDLALINQAGATLSVFLGNGDGTFSAVPIIAVGAALSTLRAADFNGDGKLDLATVDTASAKVLVFLGNGDGTFKRKASFAAGPQALGVAYGDFNADGIVDLVAANGGSPATATVLLGNGDGAFKTYQQISVSSNPDSSAAFVGAGDLDGDGVSDLIATTSSSGGLASLVTELTHVATATATGVAVSGGNTAHAVVATYPGDKLYAASLSAPADLVPETQISIGPTSINFGNQFVNTTSSIQPVTITNTGNAALYLTAIGISGSGAPAFLASDNCAASVAIHASCKINVSFTPTSAGLKTATLVFTDNGGDSPQSVALSGKGIIPPSVSLSASNVDLGSEPYGIETPVQTVTLTNSGGSALNFSSIALAGPNASSFLTSNDCHASVAVSKTCVFRFRLDPQQNGLLAAALIITDNAGGSPRSITLTGAGPRSAVTLSTNAVAFDPQNYDTESPAQKVTLTNTGHAPLNITSITAGGAHPRQFLINNRCGAVLAPHATCGIRVRVYPKIHRDFTAAVSIVDNAPDSPQAIQLSGSSIDPLTTASVTPPSLGFGPAFDHPPQTVTVTNTGTNALVVQQEEITAGDPYSSSYFWVAWTNCDIAVPPGKSCIIRIAASYYVGVVDATLSISDNTANSPQIVSLELTGYPPH